MGSDDALQPSQPRPILRGVEFQPDSIVRIPVSFQTPKATTSADVGIRLDPYVQHSGQAPLGAVAAFQHGSTAKLRDEQLRPSSGQYQSPSTTPAPPVDTDRLGMIRSQAFGGTQPSQPNITASDPQSYHLQIGLAKVNKRKF